ncbi:DUF4158 domain-containing protein [Actinomadura rudentiformis]|uniref:DUF4158 domain-containing protein n=1 Tax=Actinomadura rudentiformis TaxID=359158 RepID=UPI001CEF67E8|nr:DUF4158 domain-containing protein [Actinomadura rudentiformis]
MGGCWWSLRCSLTRSWRGCGGSLRSAGRSCSGFSPWPRRTWRSWIRAGGRGPADRLGLAVALCTLPWLGFVPDDVASAPLAAVARLATQLQVDPKVIGAYGRRAKTRTDHLRLAAQYLGWRAATALELEELDEFLLARAMEHDSRRCCSRLRAST